MTTDSGMVYRVYDGVPIRQRAADRYFDATMMCRATGKLWGHYWSNKGTQAFLAELGAVIGIPITVLVVVNQGGRQGEQGTWVHERVAMHLAQWCSPKFAVAVSGWVLDILTTGKAELAKPAAGPPAGCDWADVVRSMADGQKELALGVLRLERKVDEVVSALPAVAAIGQTVGTLASGVAAVLKRVEVLEGEVKSGRRAPAVRLTRKQRTESNRAAIRAELVRDPHRVDDVIAEAVLARCGFGVHRVTVGKLRMEMEATREIEPAPLRTRKDGSTVRIPYDPAALPFHTPIDPPLE